MGGIYKDETGGDSTNTLEIVRKAAKTKLDKAFHKMKYCLKPFKGHMMVEIVKHITAILNLDL
jgi:hypothetical protein